MMAIIAEISHTELVVRLLEVGVGLKRPVGKSADEAMADVKRMVERGKVPAYIVRDFERMATVALEYVQQCINSAGHVQ